MKLVTLKRAPVSQPVSADAVSAVIGTSTDTLVQRFGSVGDDWLGRPLLRFEHATLAHDEFLAAQDEGIFARIAFESFQEDRIARRRAAAEAAKAQAREAFVGPHRGGEEMQRWMQVQWDAERAALAAFDTAEPEITLSEFRRRRAEKNGTDQLRVS